eukprot:CAMPEP_0180250244 /NCGR_PEP_ID=MMETSP0987-20121128/37767_1 /TAXON_ID=697907 /ORGANISM="non described non described, Strain CCMP2293" /LENGTH=53 /DNA_ID=CAMNT_0022218639 /DNA_START=15 /DNA_END=173 /DNA_ORIENTATION=+
MREGRHKGWKGGWGGQEDADDATWPGRDGKGYGYCNTLLGWLFRGLLRVVLPR